MGSKVQSKALHCIQVFAKKKSWHDRKKNKHCNVNVDELAHMQNFINCVNNFTKLFIHDMSHLYNVNTTLFHFKNNFLSTLLNFFFITL
jgi:hypothetical protein